MQVTGHIRKKVNKNNVTYQLIIEFPPDALTGKRKRMYETVKCGKKEAEQILRQRLNEYSNYSNVDGSNKVTVYEWVLRWFDLYIEPLLSVTTKQGYKVNVETYIKNSSIANIQLKELSTSDVQKWINTMHKESPATGKPISAKTVKNIFHNLSAAIDKAVVNGIVPKNVCKNAILPKAEKYRETVYEEEDIQKLIDVLKDTEMYFPIMLDLSLGLRRGELLALKWHNVDFDKKLIHIEENLVAVPRSVNPNRYVIKSPKSRSGERTINISDDLVRLLKNQYRIYLEQKLRYGKGFNDEGFVICQHNGRPCLPNTFTYKFKKILKDNNLKEIRLHDIRHINATLMLMGGVSPKVAQMRLGHADFSTTMDIYSHVLQSAEQSAANTIDEALFREKKA